MTNDLETKFALMQQSHDRMQQDLTEVKQTLKDGFKELGNKFDSQREENFKTFATKEDHGRNEKRIDAIAKALMWVVGIVLTAVIGAILKLVIW